MRRALLTTLAVVAGSCLFPLWSATVEVANQPGCPLKVTLYPAGSNNLERYRFEVTNISGKDISAYVIVSRSYDEAGKPGPYNLWARRELLPGTSKRLLPAGASHTGRYIHPVYRVTGEQLPKLVVSVDWVLFADGTSWGPDTAGLSKKLLAAHKASEATLENLRYLLETQGPSAVIELIKQQPLPERRTAPR